MFVLTLTSTLSPQTFQHQDFLLFLSLFLQFQFGFFRQQTPVSSPDSRPQLQHSSSTTSPSSSSPSTVTFHRLAGHSPSSHSSSTDPAAAPGHPACPCSSPDRPGGASPGPSTRGASPPLLLPGPTPTGPGKGPTHGLWHPVRRHHPASSPTSPSSAPPWSTELLPLSLGPATCAGLPLSRSNGPTAAARHPRCGDQETPSSQSATHQRRTQCPVGSHQKRCENQQWSKLHMLTFCQNFS